MDEVDGGISIRFARVLACLPMVSLFPLCRPCDERESFRTRNLSSYEKRQLPKYRHVLCALCPKLVLKKRPIISSLTLRTTKRRQVVPDGDGIWVIGAEGFFING